MAKRESVLLRYIAAVLTTLAELDTGCPESTVYMAMGMNIHQYGELREVLVGSGLVTVSGHYIELTPKGRELAAKCQALVPA